MYTLLIADDENIEREAVKFIVHEYFSGIIEVCEASNGKEAIEMAQSFKPDIVFFDIKMPGINGIEAASRVRQILPNCRMLLISAYHYFNYAKDALTIGVDDYITKPAPEEVIISALNKSIKIIEENRARQQKEKEVDLQLKQLVQYLENEIIMLLISGETETATVLSYFKMLEIQCNSYFCIDISISNYGSITDDFQKSMMKKRFIEKMKSKFYNMGIKCFISSVSNDIYVLLPVNYNGEAYDLRNTTIDMLTKIKGELIEELLVEFSIGIGTLCTSVKEIYNSFMQAKIASKYDTSSNDIISFEDINKADSKILYPINKEKLVYESIISGNLESALIYINEIMDWMVINISNFEDLKQRVFEVLLILIREVVLNTSCYEINNNFEEIRESFSYFDSIKEIRKFVDSYISKKTAEIKTAKSIKSKSLLTIASEYIDENYNKDISLESVSEILRISPFYLSRVFKGEKGENFIDYVTTIRISKAKKLLADPVYNVKDVCYQVGYKDPNYFTRVFKKICGVTPTEYKFNLK